MNLLIYKTLSLTVPTNRRYFLHFSMIVFLVLLTGFGWYSSQLMPDIFTAGVFLVFFIVLAEKKMTIFNSVMYLTVLFFFLISHFSNVMISILLILTFLVLILFRSGLFADRLMAFKRLSVLTLGTVCSVFFLMINHYYHGSGFRPSLTPNVFLAARLTEDGIMKKYLDENCDKVNNIMCDSIKLLPTSFNDFLWPDRSYLKQIGYSMSQWEEADSAFAPIVRDILTTPRYLKMYIWEDVKGTCRQLFSLNLGVGIATFREDSAPYYPIKAHLNNEAVEFLNTYQSWGGLKFDILDLVNYFILGCSVILIFWACYFKKIPQSILFLIVICSLGYFYNAAVTSSLADVSSRFQSRISWLLVLIAMIIISFQLIQRKDLLLIESYDHKEFKLK